MFSLYLKHSLFRHYADFSGRASRMEYLCLVSLCFILKALVSGLVLFLGGLSGQAALVIFPVGASIGILIKLFLFVPICAVHVRRMHDTGRSAVPVAVLLVLFLAVSAIPFFMGLINVDNQVYDSVFLLLAYAENTFLAFLEGPYALFELLYPRVMILLLYPEHESELWTQILPGSALVLLLGLLAWLMLRRGTEGDNRYGPAPETFRDSGRGVVSAVSNCLVHGYARFAGRAGRAEYWWFVFLSMILVSVFSLPWINNIYYVNMFRQLSTVRIVLLVFCALLPQLALFLPGLAVLVRRLHDRNKSGFWLVGLLGLQFVSGAVCVWSLDRVHSSPAGAIFFLLCLLVSSCLLLWQLIMPGTKGPNRYGPDPRAGHTL